MSNTRLEVILKGRVQGVGFRFFTIRLACRYKLTGQVRNTGIDKVEVIAEGPENILKAFLKELSLGPSSARVNEVKSYWNNATGEFDKFQITYEER